ncbi:hypothetical protein [Natronococcus roseus]|uniref:hypothetical protein n=1 Tax=Natronococcus roseus TaxID=1052014 RepID=UPI00374D5DB5
MIELSNREVAITLIAVVVVFITFDAFGLIEAKTDHLMVLSGLITALLGARQLERGGPNE